MAFLEREGVLGPAEDFAEDQWIDWPEESPLSEAADAELVEAVREAEGRVFVGFKEPGSARTAASVEVRDGVRRARQGAVKAASIEAGRNVVRDLGGRITRPDRHLPMVAAVVDPEVVPELRAHPLVSWVEPSGKVETAGMSGEVMMAQQTPYNIARVRAPQAWPITQGAGARLWVLDFGTVGGFQHHLDLPQLTPFGCFNMVAAASIQDCTDESSPISPYVKHGTAVAGVAVAKNNSADLVGVAPSPGLWGSIKICINGCQNQALIDALAFLSGNGLKDVINISTGALQSSQLANAILASWNSGDILIGAAGSNGEPIVRFPAAYSQVIAVSGTNQSDGLHAQSNFGSQVELAAPYEVITLDGTSGTMQLGGTSFAAPAVSGTAALIWSLHPSWSNQQVRTWLKTTAKDLGPFGVDSQFGWGMVDAEAAVGVDVLIAGPSSVRPGEFCTWQVFVDGAAGSVSRQWSGVLSGTGSFVVGSVSSSGTLSVDVQTSTGQTGDADLFITVSSSAPVCEEQQ